MSWIDRLKEAAYTPPSGIRITFFYEDVSKESDKKTSVFTFPDKDGSYVQDLGRGARRYPLRVIFWGDDYDSQAKIFFDALEEKGLGILEHPVYGRKEVVPTGTITQIDRIKSASNQAIIEVVFWESILDLTFPSAITNPETEILDSINIFVEAAPPEFDFDIEILKSGERAGFIDKFTVGLSIIRTGLNGVAGTTESIKRQFDSAFDFLTSNISELTDDLPRLASDTIEFIRLPVQASANIEEKILSYQNVISLFTGLTFFQTFDNQSNNSFISSELLAASSQIALIESTVEDDFISKPEAINAAEKIVNNFQSIVEWSDNNRVELGLIDTGESYGSVLNSTSISAGRLVEISFTLLQEKIFKLTAPRTMIDLVAELYGQLDGRFDFFINSNNLVGTELLEIPANREIKYYE